MKKILLVLSLLYISAFGQNLYFEAFKNIQKAKKITKTNPQKANQLFIEAYSYLKQINNKSIEENKPSSNIMFLLGKMYLNGWGIEKDKNKAIKFLCYSSKLGNIRATKEIKKIDVKCKTINLKELKL